MAAPEKSEERHFALKLAETQPELIAAQRLRYRVFVTELGATGPSVDHVNARESDEFDANYDHMILIDRRIDPASLDHVVGLYRLLRSDVAALGCGFYTAAEYDLGRLLVSGRKMLELGRSCVDAQHRGGVVVNMLWNGLAEYVLRHGVEIMFGVASFHGTDLAQIAEALSYLNHKHLAPAESRVRVRPEFYQSLDLVPVDQIDRAVAMAQMPALVKAYLRMGGFIGDGAFIDRNFNTVDVFLLMDTARMSERHKRIYTRRYNRTQPA